MRAHFLTASILCAGLLAGASAATAQEATESACHEMDIQVGSALQSATSGNRDEAVRERNSGRQYCDHGYYKVGAAHLAQALKLLGAAKS